MNAGERWIIVDTETDGLSHPIHIVELSAQLMEGWEPVGEPFRMLLNHDVPIHPSVVAIHGYTQEYLRQHGGNPCEVHAAFQAYAGEHPVVSHNLNFDWNQCLEPERARFGLGPAGRRGFCGLLLARRVAHEPENYRLETLKEHFRLTPRQSHQAKNDVLALVELFQKIYRPRLEAAGIVSFPEIEKFTKRTPVAKCLALIRKSSGVPAAIPFSTDEWYYLDSAGVSRGPLPAGQVQESADAEAFYVWREGMADWAVNHQCADFLTLARDGVKTAAPPRRFESSKTMGELIGLCRGIVADDKITTAEVMFLSMWLQDAGFVAEWPASEIAQTVERIVEDGVVTKEEKAELKKLIQMIAA